VEEQPTRRDSPEPVDEQPTHQQATETADEQPTRQETSTPVAEQPTPQETSEPIPQQPTHEERAARVEEEAAQPQEPAFRPAPPPTAERFRKDEGTWPLSTFLWGGLGVALAFAGGMFLQREIGPPKESMVEVERVPKAPAWIQRYAEAFCSADAEYLAANSGGELGNDPQQFATAMAQRGWECDDIRYLGTGTVDDRAFYVYVTNTPGRGEQWWVFSTQGETVLNID
jgi:hypothetical protein